MYIDIVATITIIAPGRAFFKINLINPGLISSALGSSAIKNDPNPIIVNSHKYSWFVSYGNLLDNPMKERMINIIATNVAKIVLTKNKEQVFCKLLITLLPSATTFGSEEKLESIIISCDTFLAASLPFAVRLQDSSKNPDEIPSMQTEKSYCITCFHGNDGLFIYRSGTKHPHSKGADADIDSQRNGIQLYGIGRLNKRQDI